MPAALGPLVGFALGVVLAWLGGADPRSAEERLGVRRQTAIVALFAALVFAPVNAYFLAFAPDWSFAYLVDGRSIPSALGLLLIVVDAAVVVLGFRLAQRRAHARAYGQLVALAAVPGGLAFLLLAVLQARLRVDASYHQFQSDFGAEPVAGGPLGYALLWMDSLLCAGVVIAARALAPKRRAAAKPGAGDLESAPPPTQGAPRPARPVARLGTGRRPTDQSAR